MREFAVPRAREAIGAHVGKHGKDPAAFNILQGRNCLSIQLALPCVAVEQFRILYPDAVHC